MQIISAPIPSPVNKKNSRSVKKFFETTVLLGRFQGMRCVNFRLWNNYYVREYSVVCFWH